jgi:hypothetical protein
MRAGLNTLTSTVNFTMDTSARLAAPQPSTKLVFMSLPLSIGGTLSASAARVTAAAEMRNADITVDSSASGAARGLLQSVGSPRAQGTARATFKIVDRANAATANTAPRVFFCF